MLHHVRLIQGPTWCRVFKIAGSNLLVDGLAPRRSVCQACCQQSHMVLEVCQRGRKEIGSSRRILLFKCLLNAVFWGTGSLLFHHLLSIVFFNQILEPAQCLIVNFQSSSTKVLGRFAGRSFGPGHGLERPSLSSFLICLSLVSGLIFGLNGRGVKAEFDFPRLPIREAI